MRAALCCLAALLLASGAAATYPAYRIKLNRCGWRAAAGQLAGVVGRIRVRSSQLAPAQLRPEPPHHLTRAPSHPLPLSDPPPSLRSGWVDPNVDQLRPIPCAAGMRPAGRADAALLDAFLDAEFSAAMADTRSAAGIKRKAPGAYCASGVDPASVFFADLSGCVEQAAAPSWAQAQGVVSYSCWDAPHTVLELGVEADGQFFALRRK